MIILLNIRQMIFILLKTLQIAHMFSPIWIIYSMTYIPRYVKLPLLNNILPCIVASILTVKTRSLCWHFVQSTWCFLRHLVICVRAWYYMVLACVCVTGLLLGVSYSHLRIIVRYKLEFAVWVHFSSFYFHFAVHI